MTGTITGVVSPSRLFSLSRFHHKRDNEAKPAEVTWVELCDEFSTPRISPDKDGSLISAARFDPPTRDNKHVKSISMISYDFDRGTTDDEVQERMDRIGCAYLLHSTHSHKRKTESNPNAEPRLRVIIPLADDITPGEFLPVWREIGKRIDLTVDEAAKALAQMFYTPSIASTGMPYVFHLKDGGFLDWRKIEISRPVLSEVKKAEPVGNSINNGSRNVTLTSLAGSMQRRNMSEVAIMAALRSENQEKCNPPLPDSELEKIVKSIRRYPPEIEKAVDDATGSSVLRIKTFNRWIEDAKGRPIPKKLFGDLWVENELCINFGPTGKGKTALAVQIGESIASGKAVAGFDLGVKGKKVLYLDCELSDKQLEGRYSSRLPDSDHYAKHFKFSENMMRAEIDLSTANIESPADFQAQMQRSIGFAVAEHEIDVVIVDNITWLRDETEKARAALPLMKGLVDLKRRHNVSILVLAHTPKRDLSQAITLNHLQGSAVLANFADSIFALGESVKDPGMRYLKQLKARSTEIVYGADNVKTCQIVKEDNFLRFEFGDSTPESFHLKQLTNEDLAERRQLIARMHGEKKSQRDIAKELDISVSTVNKYVKQIDA